MHKYLILLCIILFLSGCDNAANKTPFAFNAFNYKTWEGAKLKIVGKNRKDTGFYFSTRGPRLVLKKKLTAGWDSFYYNTQLDDFDPSPRKAALVYQ